MMGIRLASELPTQRHNYCKLIAFAKKNFSKSTPPSAQTLKAYLLIFALRIRNVFKSMYLKAKRYNEGKTMPYDDNYT
jgi:hypothetical protein